MIYADRAVAQTAAAEVITAQRKVTAHCQEQQ